MKHFGCPLDRKHHEHQQRNEQSESHYDGWVPILTSQDLPKESLVREP